MFNSILFKLSQKVPYLHKIIYSHDGFNVKKEEQAQSDKDYWFGSGKLKGQNLIDDGQWIPYLPKEEYQAGRYVDSMGCTGYAFNNCLEMIAKVKYKESWNKSDRFVNKSSGTTRSGNSMRRVMDTVRNVAGLVNETSWTWDRDKFSWSDYYANIPANIKALGASFLKRYTIKYEKVYTTPQLMMSALKESPLYVAGFAWYQQNGLYRSYGTANHAFTVVGYVENSHWLAFDSYSPFVKKLAWDYNFYTAYKLYLDDKELEYNSVEIAKLRERGFRYIMRADKVGGGKGQIYELKEDNTIVELENQDKINVAIKKLANMEELTGVSEEFFNTKILK